MRASARGVQYKATCLPGRQTLDRSRHVIADIDSFLRYFDAVHRRGVRDVGALPPEAEGWAMRGRRRW